MENSKKGREQLKQTKKQRNKETAERDNTEAQTVRTGCIARCQRECSRGAGTGQIQPLTATMHFPANRQTEDPMGAANAVKNTRTFRCTLVPPQSQDCANTPSSMWRHVPRTEATSRRQIHPNQRQTRHAVVVPRATLATLWRVAERLPSHRRCRPCR